MSKPWIHAESSAKRYGGKPEDYIEVHNLMDSSKGAVPDNRHRALTHNSWFLSVILERIFGVTINNSDGKKISVRDIGEQHILEDFRMRFIPSAQDYIEHMEFQDWMNNGVTGCPSSHKKIDAKKKRVIKENPCLDVEDPGVLPRRPALIPDFVVDGSREVIIRKSNKGSMTFD